MKCARKLVKCLAIVAVTLVVPYVAIVLVAQAPGTITITRSPERVISTTEKLNPSFWLGNADDPTPPADYLPEAPDRVSKWYWRNPLHNFTFYVIGIADKEFVRQGNDPSNTFNPNGGLNFAVCKYGLLQLPFVSLKQGAFHCYWGWRPGGNFGIKLTMEYH